MLNLLCYLTMLCKIWAYVHSQFLKTILILKMLCSYSSGQKSSRFCYVSEMLFTSLSIGVGVLFPFLVYGTRSTKCCS